VPPSLYKAGLLAVELCPQRLLVKPLGLSPNSRIENKNKKMSKEEIKRAFVQNSGANPGQGKPILGLD
jgi:hypothetical protein